MNNALRCSALGFGILHHLGRAELARPRPEGAASSCAAQGMFLRKGWEDAPPPARGTRPASALPRPPRVEAAARARRSGTAGTALPRLAPPIPAAPPSPTREPRRAFSVRKCLVGGVEGGEKCRPTESRRGREVRGKARKRGQRSGAASPAAPGGVRA